MSRFYAGLLLKGRLLVALAWATAAIACTLTLPAFSETGGGKFGGLIPSDSPVVRAEIRSVTQFSFPLLARAAVVQRNDEGLDPYAQARVVLRALAYDQKGPYGRHQVLGALPVVNTAKLFPASTESGTTAITYLFTDPGLSFAEQDRLARAWARQYVDRPEDSLVGVGGTVPARVEQASVLKRSLPFVETATLVAILLVVGLNFRSVVAPLVALAVAAVCYLVTVRVLGVAGELMGFATPSDVEPLVVALMLGVITDYCIFYISGTQHHLLAGVPPREAAQRSAAEHTPIIAVAGLTVCAGVGSLVMARSDFFGAFGPALALTVLIAVLVSITLIPVLLAIVGRAVFWPARWVPASGDMPGPAPAAIASRAMRGRLLSAISRKPVALIVAFCLFCGLLLAAVPLRHADLGMSVEKSLPSSSGPARAAHAASVGFAPGILSPTVLLVEQPGIVDKRAQLTALQREIERMPGIAGVAGPADQFTPLVLGAVLSPTGEAARYLIVLNEEPLGATAIDLLRNIRAKMPQMLAAAGLSGASASFAGDTALAASIAGQTQSDLWRIFLFAALVELALLTIFLRALVAPVYLLAVGVLAVAASLGLTTLVFVVVLGHDGLSFYVPFAAAVMLVSFGADYNILGVGQVWEAARRLPMAAAVRDAVPRTTRAITAAGITLAISFGLLAVVPLAPFRELGFAMFVGIILDSVIVRSLLVPCLLVLVGRTSAWPGRTFRARSQEAGAATASAAHARGGQSSEPASTSVPSGQVDGVGTVLR